MFVRDLFDNNNFGVELAMRQSVRSEKEVPPLVVQKLLHK